MRSIANYYVQYMPFLKALADIESGNNPRAVGTKGEVSAYQILPKVWAEIDPNLPMVTDNITNIQKSGRVAAKLLRRLQQLYIKATGSRPSPQDLYIMWNRGFDFYSKRNFVVSNIEYKTLVETANRYNNLVEVYRRKCL